MIVIETSALAALYRREAGYTLMLSAITAEERRIVPASALVEFSLLRHIGASRMNWLQELTLSLNLDVYPINAEVAAAAVEAAHRFARGSRHAARLNFGDCLSYGVAKHLNAPLLYKGSDFNHTDIESALPA
jgi:ribonuclease VapC